MGEKHIYIKDSEYAEDNDGSWDRQRHQMKEIARQGANQGRQIKKRRVIHGNTWIPFI